ncbi:MAG: cytochrome c family protein [Maricaulis sp.]|jgi:cytochrome c|nr:cytochrome c family protein [Maricaulis sp.]
MRHVLLLSAAALLLAACGDTGNGNAGTADEPAAATPDPTIPTGVTADEAADAGEDAAEEADTDLPAAQAELPAPYAEADLANGRRQFRRCSSCHTVQAGGPNRVGPNLHGLFSRNAGEVDDFNYSRALQTAGIEWTPDHLDSWLADPRGYIPGNRMSFVGIPDANDRRDVIAYLMIETARE